MGCLIFLIYSNTFNASWHLDDFPNIVLNEKLHLNGFSHDEVLATFFASPQAHKFKDVYRPVACLSLALNWHFGRDNVTGYHLVNIIIHYLTAVILYLTVRALLKTPRLQRNSQGHDHCIALLSAVLWAVNPVHTQSVTYIVQRMASMAALFYLLGIFCYIKARLNHFPHYRGLLFAASITCYLLAIGSKENAAIMPLALILLEIAFFRKTGYPPGNRRTFWLAAGGAVFVFLTGALFFLKGDVFSFLNGYGARPFTIGERLLTAPRILVFYLSLLFFPLPDRLSIAHDVPYSETLIQPFTTLSSILLVVLLIGVAVYRLKKWPVLSFAILFFFLNHLIESTVIPLELVFEHRNYLPSLFLFFPVAVGLTKLYDFADKHSAAAKAGLVGIIILTIFAAGLSTYHRNTSWESEKTLWEDALEKAPGIARPYLVLAGEYEKNAQFDKALDYYKISLTLPDQRPGQARGTAYNNIGTIYFARHDYAAARKYYQEAQKVRPGHQRYLHNLTLAQVKLRKWSEASQKADLLISKDHGNADYFNLKGYILLKQNRPRKAIKFLTRAFNLAPLDRNYAVNLSLALSLTGKSRQAERILRRIYEHQPEDIIIMMSLIENSLRTQDVPGFNRWTDRLLASFSAGEIEDFLKALDDSKMDVPLAVDLLAPAIAERLKHKFKASA